MRISVFLHRQGLCTAVHNDSRLLGAAKVHEHCAKLPTARHRVKALLYIKRTHATWVCKACFLQTASTAKRNYIKFTAN